MKIKIESDIRTGGRQDADMSVDFIGRTFKDHVGGILSAVAVMIAFFLLPLGILMNVGAGTIRSFMDGSLVRCAVILSVVAFLMIAVSAACGIMSIVLYGSSEKSTPDLLSLPASILSLVICTADLALILCGWMAM